MKIAGIFFIVIGLMLTLTIIGAWVGIPLMIVGAILAIAGRRPATITNIVQVSGHPGATNGVQMTPNNTYANLPPVTAQPQAIDVQPQRNLPES